MSESKNTRHERFMEFTNTAGKIFAWMLALGVGGALGFIFLVTVWTAPSVQDAVPKLFMFNLLLHVVGGMAAWAVIYVLWDIAATLRKILAQLETLAR